MMVSVCMFDDTVIFDASAESSVKAPVCIDFELMSFVSIFEDTNVLSPIRDP